MDQINLISKPQQMVFIKYVSAVIFKLMLNLNTKQSKPRQSQLPDLTIWLKLRIRSPIIYFQTKWETILKNLSRLNEIGCNRMNAYLLFGRVFNALGTKPLYNPMTPSRSTIPASAKRNQIYWTPPRLKILNSQKQTAKWSTWNTITLQLNIITFINTWNYLTNS